MLSTDIYNLLLTKTHNKHYLNRYWKYLNSVSIPKNYLGKTQNHHILPQASDLFPEYAKFKDYPWNKIQLTLRQHFIAHILLWKTFGGSQTLAAYQMKNKNGETLNSTLYEKLMSEFYTIQSKNRKGWCTLYDSDGNAYKIKSIDKHLYPNLKGNRAGILTIIDPTGKKLNVSTNDPKVLSGEYISILKNITRKKYTRKSKKTYKAGRITLKHVQTGEVKIFNNNDIIDRTLWVGVNSGNKLSGNYGAPTVCCIITKKEYSGSNWLQHLRKEDKPKIKKILYSCVCDITTKKHYDKAGWNKWIAPNNPTLKIQHKIEQKTAFYYEKYV
jgi:hypothetical protein